MLKDLKLSAAVMLLQAGQDGSQFGFRDTQATRRSNERAFGSSPLPAASNMALSDKTSNNQERRHVQP